MGTKLTFADLANGSSVFLDANTLIYHLTQEMRYGAACTALLERVERGELHGWTSPHLLAEVAHRIMTIDACRQFGWPVKGIAARMRSHPREVQQLTLAKQSLDQVARFALRIAPSSKLEVVEAMNVSRQFGLLTNDSWLVAIMQSLGLTNLASLDSDFDQVPWIVRFAPC